VAGEAASALQCGLAAQYGHRAAPAGARHDVGVMSVFLFDCIFQIAISALGLADGLVHPPFDFELFVADKLTGHFLDLAFDFLDVSFYLILVHARFLDCDVLNNCVATFEFIIGGAPSSMAAGLAHVGATQRLSARFLQCANWRGCN
jgi:hypothetical protein